MQLMLFLLPMNLNVYPPLQISLISSLNFNSSLSSDFKHAMVRLLLNKLGVTPVVFSNFQPISELTFLWKVLEKVIYDQHFFLPSITQGSG